MMNSNNTNVIESLAEIEICIDENTANENESQDENEIKMKMKIKTKRKIKKKMKMEKIIKILAMRC